LLSSTAYIVLGLIERAGECTPYDLKQMVGASVGNFWSVPHSQLYAEPGRLVSAGLLHERREEGGRRRRLFSLTEEGRQALSTWLEQPSRDPLPELRDPGLLRLFFGAKPAALATARLQSHRAKLAEYEAQAALDRGDGLRGPWLALEAGLRHEREWVRFWGELAGEG
jgi:PadR family transcriptional regulator, regulatory protein AphA